MAQARQRKTSTTHTVTSGTVVRIEQPKSSRQQKQPIVKVIAQEVNPTRGFVGFLREHAVVGLAVGFAIGSQAQQLIKDLVSSFIDPMFDLLFGQSLAARTFTWHLHGRAQDFHWGQFTHSLLSFLFVLLVIYLILKFFNLDEFDKVKEEDDQ